MATARSRYKSFTIRPSDGGTLAPALSEDLSQNPSNYEVKQNFRREHDFEVRREGWEFFRPFQDVVLVPTDFPETWDELRRKELQRRLRGQCLASPDPIQVVEQFESGRRITVAGTPTSIYLLNGEMRNTVSDALRYFNVTGSQDSDGNWSRPEPADGGNIHPGRGYYVENYEDPTKNYLWSDREDLEDLVGDVDGWTNITPYEYKYERLSGRYLELAAKANTEALTEEESASFEALEALSAEKRGFTPGQPMEVDYLNGFVIFNNGRNLPAIYHSDWPRAYPIYELREIGVVSVGNVAQYEGYLLLSDVTVFDTPGDLEVWGRACESGQGPDFYGSVLDSAPYKSNQLKLRNVSYRILYSNPGAPHRWGFVQKSRGDMGTDNSAYGIGTNRFRPLFKTETAGATNRLSGTFAPGTRVEISLVHSDGNVATPIEATVVSWDGSNYVLNKTIEWIGAEDGQIDSDTDTSEGITGYMRRVNNYDDSDLVFANTSSYIDAVGDGSRIISLNRLRDRLVVFRESGYALLSTVNVTTVGQSPFTYELRYSGDRVPVSSKATVVVNDQRILYAGKEDIYSISASYSEPSIPAKIDFAKEFGYGDTMHLTDNSLTGEIFICGTEKTIAFDYKYDTVSEIDCVFTCGKTIRHPVTGLNVFLLGTSTQIELAGLENPAGGYYPRSHALFQYSYDQASDLEHTELGNVPQVFSPDGARRYVREKAIGGVVYRADTDDVKVTYDSILESGWIDLNRRMDEKDYRMYLLDFHADPSNVFIRESADGTNETVTSVLPIFLPFQISPMTFPTYSENRIALSDHQEYEVKQEPDHRLLVEPPFLVNVKLFTKDSMGGVSRIELDEDLTIRDELAIPMWCRAILIKDRITMQGPDSGKIYSRSFEASLVGTGARTLSIRS